MNQSNGTKATSSQSEILLAEGLRMVYASRVALQDLSFSLKAGRVLGFLGPNGAGKTTAIRILTTIMAPTAGRFVIDGVTSDHPEKIRSRIGVLPESLGFQKQSTALELLTYFGQLYGRTASDAKATGLALLEEVGLQQRARTLIGTFSRGMRQRLGIARTLVNDPVVVFLDEPTLGLDPHGQHELLALIQRVARERNTAVVLCSHLLSEIEDVCDDVVIMNSGRVVAHGTVNEVVGGAQQNVLRVHVPTSVVGRAKHVLEGLPGVMNVSPRGSMAGWLVVALADSVDGMAAQELRAKNNILDMLMRADIPIQAYETKAGRLQDVFFELTEEGIK